MSRHSPPRARLSWVALTTAVLVGCPTPEPDPSDPRPQPMADADIFVDQLGDPAPLMPESLRPLYERGREVMARRFGTHEGLGPTFNASSCASCHQVPVAGGSAPRYRDFFLIQTERFDGARVDAGTNGSSPVLNLYATDEAGRHLPPPHGTVVHARRNAPPGFGVGLFHFIPSEVILERSDPDDLDGDGISGRPNFEGGRVGKFGYKLQAHSLESFNRGAAFNQMGITTDPLFHVDPSFPEEDGGEGRLGWRMPQLPSLITSAWAQVAALDEPTLDDDGVPDPEMSNDDQLALLVFSIYLGAPRPSPLTPDADEGATTFQRIGCADCHVPRLNSTVGAIPAYTDLLLHNMGPNLADELGPGLSTGTEFRTQPLWGVALHGPFLHDGRADTLADAILWHGGEAQPSRDRFASLNPGEQAKLIAFLEALGGWPTQGQVLVTPDAPRPEVGSLGGPDVPLTESEWTRWLRGRALFDHTFDASSGLGPHLNADSCRACHQDPVLGGAGGVDVNVLRVGARSLDDGRYLAAGPDVVPRVVLPGHTPYRASDAMNVVEPRQSPSLLGAGLINRIADAAIRANADPDDLDGDGIAGRVREVNGAVGRFGWKNQIPNLIDFAADALFQEMGLTADTEVFPFSGTDDDDMPDPEISTDDVLALAFYISHLAPPPRGDTSAEGVAKGETLFSEIGCAACHLPILDGVPLYSDLLLHDVAPDPMRQVDQDPEAGATSFRTPPLWGVQHTAPYLHHGLAPTLRDAILGHGGTASASRGDFEALSSDDQAALIAFLKSL